MQILPTSVRVEEADILLTEASLLLEKYKNTIDSANYVMAMGWLEICLILTTAPESTRDFRDGIEAKSMLRRHQQAQAYYDKAQETHQNIKACISAILAPLPKPKFI
ncbi:hypothetical protein BJV74DRAFT_799254 [Russula compacta]|nr:hypothetical protein BJV74DRAFT_799254 [Russula compacta]